jgi:hypothetical protein
MTDKTIVRFTLDIEIDSEKASELPDFVSEYMRSPWAGIDVARYELLDYLSDVVLERWEHLDARVYWTKHEQLIEEPSKF